MNDILKVQDLYIQYKTDEGIVYALNGVSIDLKAGETLGIVGETGAGKTTLARGIMGLIPKPPGQVVGGQIFYGGQDLLQMNERGMRSIRGREISMIFQDPMTSLNPVMTVSEQIAEVLHAHNKVPHKEAIKKACEMLELVGIPAQRGGEYPHQFSGGMKQRVMIGIALACNPNLLVADEPTTALDVTIQAQILEMLSQLKEKLGTSILLITHDLGVVAQNCNRVCIMYGGQVVETGNLDDIFYNTAHPYTKGLIQSIPVLTQNVTHLSPIPGSAPDPTDTPQGCRFAPRCLVAIERCKTEQPLMGDISETHQARCFLTQTVEVS